MKIIALKGGNSCGKTSTLNMVYDELITSKGATPYTAKTLIGHRSKADFECVITYLSKKVAFYTMGDYARLTINAIDKYEKLLVDVLIVATNDKFVMPTRKIITYPHDIILKTSTTPKNTANNLIANTTDCRNIISCI